MWRRFSILLLPGARGRVGFGPPSGDFVVYEAQLRHLADALGLGGLQRFRGRYWLGGATTPDPRVVLRELW